MEADVPKTIGRYSIDRLLGAGAMGFVYLARDEELDRAVAVKTIRDLGLAPDAMQTFFERFRNEARAAAKLHHPAIVQVYDVGQDDRVGPYLVFEYVPGATLKEILKTRGPLPPEQLVDVADQVGAAIDTAHAADVIHRDIKPDNLLLTEAGQTKLADFGVARTADAALTKKGQFLGTPCYAAPETLSNGEYGPHTDLFSFAAVLYELSSGTRAFPGNDAVAVAHKVVHDTPPDPGSVAKGEPIPKAVDAVLMRALSKHPDERFATATELSGALRDAYLDAQVIAPTAREASRSFAVRSPTTRAPKKKSGLAFAAVLLGGLAVGVAVVVAVSPSGGPSTPTVDAGVVDAAMDADADQLALVADGGPTEDADAEPLVVILDASANEDADASAEQPMTAHEREEAAKDAIDAARAAIASGDVDAAAQALDRARSLDPDNDDIATLEAALSNLGS